MNNNKFRRPHLTSAKLNVLQDFLRNMRTKKKGELPLLLAATDLKCFNSIDNFLMFFMKNDYFLFLIDQIHEWWREDKMTKKVLILFQLLHQLEYYKRQMKKKDLSSQFQEQQQGNEKKIKINNDEALIDVNEFAQLENGPNCEDSVDYEDSSVDYMSIMLNLEDDGRVLI